MDNNQNNVYQVPTSPPSSLMGESFDAPFTSVGTELSQAQIDEQFLTIAHEEILLAYNARTRDLHRAADGIEVEELKPVDVFTLHPIISDLLQLGNGVIDGRAELHKIEMEPSSLFDRILGRKNS